MFKMANMADARKEMTKTREQLEEEKRISLSIRIKPLDLDGKTWPHVSRPLIDLVLFLGLYKEDLRSTATELWQTIVRLETEKYDLQERQKRQDYDVSNSQSFEIHCCPLFFYTHKCCYFKHKGVCWVLTHTHTDMI